MAYSPTIAPAASLMPCAKPKFGSSLPRTVKAPVGSTVIGTENGENASGPPYPTMTPAALIPSGAVNGSVAVGRTRRISYWAGCAETIEPQRRPIAATEATRLAENRFTGTRVMGVAPPSDARKVGQTHYSRGTSTSERNQARSNGRTPHETQEE